jgi:flagellar hook-associated protein 2
MAGISLSGLASGIDTNAIVSQLMAIERQGANRTRLDQARLAARDTGLKDVSSKLAALRSAAQAMRAPDVWADRQTVESSNPTQVSVERRSGSGTGATSIRVTGLAASAQHTYTFAPSTAARTFEVTPTGGTAVPVTVGPDATLDDLVAAINGSSTSAVFAAAVRTDPNDPATARLVLSSRTTGATSDFTLSEGGAPTADVAGTARIGKDATYFLDGETDPAKVHTSSSNVVDNAVAGLRLTLKGVSPNEVTLNVGAPVPDVEGAKAKVKAFVEAYNAVILIARGKTGEKTVPTATTATDAAKGQLFGDQGLNTMVNAMRSNASLSVPGNLSGTDDLGDLGISTGAIGAGRGAATGTLVIDDAKLTADLAADPRAVQRLLGGVSGTPGIAQRIEGLVADQIGATDGLDSTGLLDQRLKTTADEQRRLSDALTRMEERSSRKEKRLLAQFALMESALQASQTQQSWLSGQVSSLSAR